MYSRDIRVLRKHVEKLGLDQAPAINRQDLASLVMSLNSAGEQGLAALIKPLSENELQDLIVNTIYG